MKSRCKRTWRAGIGAVVLLGGLVTGVVRAETTHAAYMVCREDPIVRLSNGAVITLWVDIADAESDVQSVNYVLHAPEDVTIRSVVYDANGPKEHVQLINDLSHGRYGLVITVSTGLPANVDAYASYGEDRSTFHVSGISGSPLVLSYRGGNDD